MPRNYPAGGAYRGQYSQQQSRRGGYESLYTPIPIEFLQEQLRGRQQDYDVSYAGALSARDQLAQQQVGMADIASKNQLIQEGADNINKLVEEKYGGDWSRAAKEVASSITQLRADPFWNAQKEMEKRRTAFQTDVTKAGARGMIFGADPRQMTTMTAEGQVRGVDELTGRVVEAGDWTQTARELMGGLTADQFETYDIDPEEYRGFMKGETISHITRKKIEEMAKDPAIQDAFLRQHPEFREGFEQLDDAQKRKFGLEGENIQDIVRDQLLGVSASSEFRKQALDVRADPYDVQRAGKTDVPITSTTNPSEIVGRHYEGQQRSRDVKFNDDGTIQTAEQRVATAREPSINSMMPVFNHFGVGAGAINLDVLLAKEIEVIRKGLRKLTEGPSPHPKQLALYAIAQGAKSGKEFLAKAQEAKDQAYVDGIRESHNELGEYTDQETVSLKQTADEDLAQTSSTLYSYGLDWQQATTQEYVYDTQTKTPGRMFGQELYLDGQLVSGTKKEELFAKELGYKPGSDAMNEALQSSRISDMSYGGNTPGEMVMTIKDEDGNNRTVEISPSREVQELSTPSWIVGEFIRSGGTSSRIQDYLVHEVPARVDEEGNLITHSGSTTTIEGQEYPVFYHVNDNIVSTSTDNKTGRHEAVIQMVVYKEGENQPYVINENVNLSQIINFDKSQVEEWLKKNKNLRQTQL